MQHYYHNSQFSFAVPLYSRSLQIRFVFIRTHFMYSMYNNRIYIFHIQTIVRVFITSVARDFFFFFLKISGGHLPRPLHYSLYKNIFFSIFQSYNLNSSVHVTHNFLRPQFLALYACCRNHYNP